MTDVPAATLTACTVASVAELPSARVMLRSFLDHHPDARCQLLLVDADGELPEVDRVDVLHPTEIGVARDELDRLRTACAAEQLGTALRPRLMSWLLCSPDTSGPVLYLAPSVLVLAPVADLVLAGLVQQCLVLLPRSLRPLPDDGRRPDAADLRTAGVFDSTLVAVNRGAEALLRSWSDHTLHQPEDADAFLDGAAAMLEPAVLRDPGVGLSVWNAGQRTLHADGERPAVEVDGKPLRTVHFAGFDPARPWLLSARVADRPRVLLSEQPLLARLCAHYVSLLADVAEFEAPTAVEQRVGPAGLPATLRAEYRMAWLAADRAGQPPPAACAGDRLGFLDWACGPVDQRPGGTRWSAALWQDDPDLRDRFPDPSGVDAVAFREWCAGPGVSCGILPPDAVPGVPEDEPTLTDQLGVSVLGEGAVADLLRSAAVASGLPLSDRPDYPVVVRCDDVGVAADLVNRRYVVSVLSTPGKSEGTAADEIWILSSAARSDVARAAGVPVHALTLPVADPGHRDTMARNTARQRLGWPVGADAVVFAGLVDHAHEHADNALGVVSAFRSALGDRADVALLLLVSGAEAHPDVAERLRLATATDERIRLVEGGSRDERAIWLDTADCVLCWHRVDQGESSRVALAIAEPAAKGIPLVGAATGAVGALLPTVGALFVPGDSSGPDDAVAAQVLRAVADDPEGAARIGLLGRTELLRTHSVTAAGELFRDRIEHAYRAWRARRAVVRPEPHGDPLRPLRSARHALLREPDVDVGHKIPMAPAFRKAVLRVLNHYDAHLRTVLGTLVDGIERTAEELARRQEAQPVGNDMTDADLLTERLDRLFDRVTQWDDRVAGVDNGVLRIRADLAGQARRVDEVEDVVVGEATKRGKQIDVLADRIDRLTEALNRTLDRIDGLEARTEQALHERDVRAETGLRAASHALRTSDALRRVVVRDHERRTEPSDALEPPEDVPNSLVLCDAGLLRLPADDGVMLPLLSSNGVWEPELSALIDSLVEPDAAFVDIGAYVGYHTLRVLSRLGTSGAVVAVEPSEPAIALLRHNVAANVPNAVAQRLTVVSAAAWDTAGALATEPALTGGVAVRPCPTGPEEQETETPVHTVPAVRLDREFEENASLRGLRLSVVKVDTPGRGHRALGGFVRILRRDRPHVFCAFSATRTTEVGDDPATVLREFGTWGYDVVLLGDHEPSTPQQILDVAERQHSTTLWLRPRGGSG